MNINIPNSIFIPKLILKKKLEKEFVLVLLINNFPSLKFSEYFKGSGIISIYY
jgi:hypothetical protein